MKFNKFDFILCKLFWPEVYPRQFDDDINYHPPDAVDVSDTSRTEVLFADYNNLESQYRFQTFVM